MLLSKLFNACLKFRFNSFHKTQNILTLDFKADYRTGSGYSVEINAINAIVKEDTMPCFQRIDDGLCFLDLENILGIDTYYDFKDKIISEICIRNNLILIIDNADFGQIKRRPIILISNKKLLRFH